MDRRLLKVLLMSLVFALVVSAIFYQMLVAGRGKGRPRADLRDIVVAAHPLALGMRIRASDLKVVRLAGGQVPADGFSKMDAILDRPVGSSILQDEPIREARLAPKGSGPGLAPMIPPGMRAVSVKVNEVVGVAGFVIPGMRVDVLVTGRLPREDSSVTRTALQNILVISAGQNVEPDAKGQAINAPVVTLLVTPEQAETLTLAGEWRVQLVLRNGSDATIAKTTGRRLTELFGAAEKVVEPAPAPPVRRAAPKVRPVPPPPPAPPPAAEEVVVFRGTQRTVEQVGVRNP
jgi:pilus assembly protein CpaB